MSNLISQISILNINNEISARIISVLLNRTGKNNNNNNNNINDNNNK